jgi:ADP-heptose:LPS heptosyltransferase
MAMKNILVIKHGALGDIIQAIDAFESLRRSFPHARINLLTAPAFAPLLAASGWFDEVVTDPRKPIWHLQNSLRLAKLFKRPFEGIIDLQCSSRTAAYFRLMRPKARWFGTAAGCSDPMPDFTGVNNRTRMMIAAQMAGAGEHIGNLDFLADAPMEQEISLPARYSIPARYCIFVAGSSRAKPSKRWPSARFAAIARYSLAQSIPPLLCGTAEDKEVNAAIKAECPEAIDLTGQTSIAYLARLMGGAEFILGNDTGPVFLGARTNRPTLMVMGADTDPDMSAPTGKYADYLYQAELSELPAQKVWQKLQEIRQKAH